MKRLPLAILLLCSTLALSAQSRGARYQGEILTGYGVSNKKSDRIYLHTLHGCRFGEHFFAGIGAGATAMVAYLDVDVGFGDKVMGTLFTNFKGYVPIDQKTNLFASLDAGLVFDGGPMYSLSVGLNLKKARNNALNLSLGHEAMSWSGYTPNALNERAVVFKIGYQF